MGRILGAYLSPHPPIIVEEIGRGEELKAEKTLMGMRKLARDIKEKKPTTIVLVTPHGPLFSDAISISAEEDLEGSFENFGYRDLKFQFKNNTSIVNGIIDESGWEGIMLAAIDKEFARDYGVSEKVDHGALVPLYFVNKEYTGYKLVHITYGLLSPLELYKFGMIIQKVVENSDEDVVFIASGDLSHKLSGKAPYGYSKEGKIFDEKIAELLGKSDYESIASFDLTLGECAGECGLRSLIVLSGFLDGFHVDTEVYSYEGPFGVGYCTAGINILGHSEDRKLYEKLKKKAVRHIEEIRNSEDEFVRLARKSLEYYIANGKQMKVPDGLSNELVGKKAGVFVSLKKDGRLRGCIGTIEPTQNSIAEEIIKNAISAGTNDPRFSPIEEDELDKIVYSVDVLEKPEKIDSMAQLDVKEYGVIVSKGYRRGLLLPNLEGVDTPKEQVRIALQKAGIDENENFHMERFRVVRHH